MSKITLKGCETSIDILYGQAKKRDSKKALEVYGRYLGDAISEGKARFLLRMIVRYGGYGTW